jgi:hypothetical protein
MSFGIDLFCEGSVMALKPTCENKGFLPDRRIMAHRVSTSLFKCSLPVYGLPYDQKKLNDEIFSSADDMGIKISS